MERGTLTTIACAAAGAGVVAIAIGCAQFMRVEDQAAEQTARGITKYCENTDQAFRERYRAKVNALAAPHSAAISCN